MKLPARAALLLSVGLTGCASSVAWCGVRTYRPLVLSAPSSRYAAFEAARRAAMSLGPSRLEVADGELALSAIVDGTGATREHIQIAVTDRGELTVDVRTEVEVASGRWVAPETVCDDYSHARERSIADRILTAVVPSL